MAPKSDICDWQLECSDLKQRGAHLLKSGEWSDCSFSVGSEPEIVKAHKLILAMASPVFEAMFYGSMAAEGNEPVPISDVQPEAFKALLEYIYMDNININSFGDACDLCYGAKKYMLPHLMKECIKYLWSKINAKNACQVYEYARLLEENVLMEKCLQVISLNTKEVLQDSSFNDIDYDTMRTVFSLEHLNVESEMDLFKAAHRHAKAQIKQLKENKVVNVDSSADSSPETGGAKPEPEPGPCGSDACPENREKQTIRGAIAQIRFLTLSPQQFAEGPAESPLLTESEAFAVFMHISTSQSKRPNVPLPRGFSASREPRQQLTKRKITLSDSFTKFIDQEFRKRDMLRSSCYSNFSCSCMYSGYMSISDYAAHYFAYCYRLNTERLDFEVVCRAFKVDPFSEDIKNHKDTREALDIFLNQIKLRPA